MISSPQALMKRPATIQLCANTSMASTHKERSRCCFKEWMQLQAQDLDELLQALQQNGNNVDDSEHFYTQLAQKGIIHFQDYMHKRSQLFHEEASAYMLPSWCTSLENSSLWIGGCRPSSFIRLVYGLDGCYLHSLVDELMQGTKKEHFGELSPKQLVMINNLHMKTIKEEDRMSRELASLQEGVVDNPIFVLAKNSSQIGEQNGEVERVLGEHDAAIANIIEDADKLRLSTLKQLMDIFRPMQAADFLAASKKLHLCIHEWGKTRDRKHGRI